MAGRIGGGYFCSNEAEEMTLSERDRERKSDGCKRGAQRGARLPVSVVRGVERLGKGCGVERDAAGPQGDWTMAVDKSYSQW